MSKKRTGLFLLLILLAACNPPEQFVIEGEFTVKDPTPIELYLLKESGKIRVDSITVKSETFRMSGPVTYPGIYQLKFFNEQEIFLIIAPGDRIKLRIDNKYPAITYYVENSFESKRVKELMDRQEKTLRQIDQLSVDWDQHKGDTLIRKKIDSAYMAIMHEQKVFTRNFIYAYPSSLANVMAVYMNFGKKSQPLFDPYDDFDIFRFVDSNLVAVYPNSAPVLALNKEVNELKDNIRHKKFIKKMVEAGLPVPPLKYPDLKGDTLVIEEPLQQPVVILFWATWNPYSTKELLRMNTFAQQPEARKIQIITISLDTKKDKLNDYIQTHAIILPVICDYSYWDSELVGRYAVKQIPSTILTDQNGLILARDIFGNELYNQINDLLK